VSGGNVISAEGPCTPTKITTFQQVGGYAWCLLINTNANNINHNCTLTRAQQCLHSLCTRA